MAVWLPKTKKGKRKKKERKRALVHFSTGKWRRRKDALTCVHFYTKSHPLPLFSSGYPVSEGVQTWQNQTGIDLENEFLENAVTWII